MKIPTVLDARTMRLKIGEPSVGIQVDLRHRTFDYQTQLARARRALDKFRHFENVPANEEAATGLLDDFLVTAETIRHCKDWFQRALEDKGVKVSLKEYLKRIPRQGFLADICNASKHVNLNPKRNQTTGDLHLSTGNRRFTQNQSLGDLYAELYVGGDNLEPQRAVEFLEDCLSDWEYFAELHLVHAGKVHRAQTIMDQFKR